MDGYDISLLLHFNAIVYTLLNVFLCFHFAFLNFVGVAMMRKRSNSVRLFLTVMLICVCVCTLPYVSSGTSLLLVCSFMLSVHCLYRMVEQVMSTRISTQNSTHFMVRIHGHAFTSPDAPINAPEEDIPKRFIDAVNGDMKEARLRWDTTRHWREQEVSSY